MIVWHGSMCCLLLRGELSKYNKSISSTIRTSLFPRQISPRPLPVSGGSFTVREGHTVPVPEGIIQLILSQPVIPSTSSYFTHVQTDAFLPHKTGTQQSYLSSHPKALFTYKQLQSAQQRNIVYNHSSEVNPRTIGNFLASGRRYTYDDNRPYNKTSNRRFNFEDNSIFNSAADSSVEMFQVLREPREGSLRVEDATDATLVFFSRAQLERGRLMVREGKGGGRGVGVAQLIEGGSVVNRHEVGERWGIMIEGDAVATEEDGVRVNLAQTEQWGWI